MNILNWGIKKSKFRHPSHPSRLSAPVYEPYSMDIQISSAYVESSYFRILSFYISFETVTLIFPIFLA